MKPTATALAIASSADNIRAIVRETPDNYSKNQLSSTRCIEYGQQLLDQIQATGMTDDLDRQAAVYIEKTRRTIKTMNERRAPLTKLFDQVRKEFTGLENDIDPLKAGTLPNQLQQLRNQYAARKREEEERKRKAEEEQRQAQMVRVKYRQDVEEDYKAKFNELINTRINELTDLNSSVTLSNYQEVYDKVKAYPVELPSKWVNGSGVHLPLSITREESRQILLDAFEALQDRFEKQFRAEIGDYRQEILDKLPSKKEELERAARADQAEAARIKAEIQKREAAEAARKEAERIAREQEEAKKAEAAKAGSKAVDLFNLSQSQTAVYQPKTKVTKKINITGYNGYMHVMALWWAKEGSLLSKLELDKIFKKQITFCEKLANKEEELINDPSIEYIDNVKAQ